MVKSAVEHDTEFPATRKDSRETWYRISGVTKNQPWNMIPNFRRRVKSAVWHDTEFPATRKVNRGAWQSAPGDVYGKSVTNDGIAGTT
jgi:hypothetical protein